MPAVSRPTTTPVVTPDPAVAGYARDISQACTFNGHSGKGHNLTDGTYARDFSTGLREGARGLEIQAPVGEVIGALYIQWHSLPQPLNIQTRDKNGNWVTVADCDALLDRLEPKALISIERCGRDVNGIYANMRHVDISAGTAPCDALFLKALGTIPTIGVGDGGNEIGMGNVAEAVRTRLDLVPAEVKADILVIATVSNWGAYGIVAALEQLTRLPLLLSFSKAERFLRRTVGMGSVDGISHEHIVRVDGFGMETEKEILDGLHEYNSVRLHALAS